MRNRYGLRYPLWIFACFLLGCASQQQLTPTKERFTADFVLDQKSGVEPPSYPPNGQYFGSRSVYSGSLKLTTMFVVGNYTLQIEPATRKPIKLTLLGIQGPLTWQIDDPETATLSSHGNEAILNFQDVGVGAVKIVVRSGKEGVFRLSATAVIVKGCWQVNIDRVNEQGNRMDMYGEIGVKQ